MNDDDLKQREELHRLLESVRRRLRKLTVAVMLMTLMLILTVAVVFGDLVNYFAADAMMLGGVSAGAAILGFAFGWVARRKA